MTAKVPKLKGINVTAFHDPERIECVNVEHAPTNIENVIATISSSTTPTICLSCSMISPFNVARGTY